MARRDLSGDFRSVIQNVVKDSSSFMSGVAELSQRVVEVNQKAKITENTASAQMELNALTNQFQIDNQADPTNQKALSSFKAQQKSVLDKYGSDISPFYRAEWNEKALQLSQKTDAYNQAWGIKQTQTNTIFALESAAEKNMEMAYMDGQALASGSMSDIEALINFDTNRTNMEQFGNPVLGEVSTAQIMKGLDDHYATALISGAADKDPYYAKRIMDNGTVDHLLDLNSKIKLNDEIDKGILKLEKAAMVDQQLLIDDPAAWGAERNMPVADVVAMQPVASVASVIGNKQAKAGVAVINSLESVDQVALYAEAFKEKYGDYTANAMRDLKKGGLTGSSEFMFSLAMDDPVKYAQEIDLLQSVAKSGDKGLNELYTQRIGEKPSASGGIEQQLITDNKDITGIFYTEGMGIDQINSYNDSVGTLAKAYLVRNPSKSQSDAIAFARQSFDSSYKIAELNGVKYRVPVNYDVDKVQSRSEDFLDDGFKTGQFVINNNRALAKSMKDELIPFMSFDGSGIQFRTGSGALLMDAKGGVAEFKYDSLLKDPTKTEARHKKVAQKNLTLQPTGMEQGSVDDYLAEAEREGR